MRELNSILNVLPPFSTMWWAGTRLLQNLNSRAGRLFTCARTESIFRLHRLFWGLLIQSYRVYLWCSNLDGTPSSIHCIFYALYLLCIVSSMRCIFYALYLLYVVSSIHCCTSYIQSCFILFFFSISDAVLSLYFTFSHLIRLILLDATLPFPICPPNLLISTQRSAP